MRLRMFALHGALCLLSSFWLLGAVEARAHGVMGKREFIHPFVGEHAPVKNEFVAHGHYIDNRDDPDGWVVGWEIEKTITDGTSVFLEGGARFHTIPHAHGGEGHAHDEVLVPGDDDEHDEDHDHDDGMGDSHPSQDHDHGMHADGEMESGDHPEPRSGFDNLEGGLKHQVFTSERHETIVSLAAFVKAPTGTVRAGAEDHAAVGFQALFARGLGDLPGGLSWLRPLAVQTDTGVEVPLGAGTPDTEMVANVALQYDLSVLHELVACPRWMERFVVSTEFNLETPLGGPERGETETFVTTGLTWRSKQVQLGLAFQVPLEGGIEQRFAVLPMISWFYDVSFPRLGRNLIQ